MTGNPLAGHLRSHSLSGSGYSISPTSYHPPLQQTTFQGYPVTTQHGRSQSLPNTLTPYPNQNPRHTNVIQGILRNGNGRTSRESTIPSVAEQLDEKKRLRTGRQSSSGGPPRSRSAYAGIGSRSVSRTGSSGQLSRTSGCQDELNTRSNTAVISHARSQSQSQISAVQGSNTSSLTTDIHDVNNNNSSPSSVVPDCRPSAGGINKRASHSRRLSLKNAPWNRRRTVMNLGSDASSETDAGHPVNSIIPSNVDTHGTSAVAPLPLGGMVAAAGHTTTVGDVIAAVPGARLPTARDRENPPPEYTSAA
ncbi:uncharacterized protein FOMMEDRAFT_19782 [Fomitiporia mediterranea MF3/22]|uniref:uncharacterized protein n=1 Tax=Fomitiporia mediterranea (strain MF3/22) TaxID=694068 RepID=UPI0004408E80|nr:uncharacterized protein FOMMEDRAFT_19782 [Fomitiporia mediterranea MF3/22]EJD04557.1 hypothetical protein FOMMEDRAFT_19782 [Fomitiporia mediterranea MF3/22]